MHTSGVVEKVSTQEGQGNYGPWTKVSFQINGQWYGTFEKKDNKKMLHSVSEGDVVSVVFDKKGDFNNLTSIEVEKSVKDFDDDLGKVKAFQGQDKAQPAPAKDTAKPYNVQEKDYRITFQAATKVALPFVQFALEKELLTLGKGKNKVDALQEYVLAYADVFARAFWEAKYKEVKPEVEEDDGDAKEYVE